MLNIALNVFLLELTLFLNFVHCIFVTYFASKSSFKAVYVFFSTHAVK